MFQPLATQALDAKPIEYGGSFFEDGARWFRVVFHLSPEAFAELEPSAVHGWILETLKGDKWRLVDSGKRDRTCVEVRAKEMRE